MTITAHPDLRTHTSGAARLARAAADVSVPPRRALQLALAVLWLLDAALQYQPYMFTKAFVTSTLAPTAHGNPAVVAGPMRWTSHLISGHPAAFNFAFATAQLAIAAGLLWPRTVKAALGVSVAWAVGVWWFGEGLGGVLTGASPVTGAPGAVILYALAALLLWPRAEVGDLDSVAVRGALGRRGARLAWAGVWGVLAYLFLLPANRAPGALHHAVAGMASGQPAWLASIDRGLASVLTANSTTASIILAISCYLIAMSVFVPRLTRPGIAAAAALGAVIWVAQAFGGIFTGQGTDPNSGLPLVLLAAAYWPLSHTRTPTSTPGLPSTAPSNPRRPDRHVGMLAAGALAVSAIAAGLGVAPGAVTTPTMTASMPVGMTMPPGSSMPAGTSITQTRPPSASATPALGPSQSSRMVCSEEVHRDIATSLSLPADPPSTSTWADHLYTCTYRLAAGPLVIAVKELDGVPAARAYFAQMRQQLPTAQPILGLASLGLPGYQTSSGTVSFLKDDKTLSIDATAITGPVGPNRVSPTDFSYQIATDILGCWSGR